MTTTRQPAHFQIYQDPPPPPMQPQYKPRPRLQPSAMPLQPLSNVQTQQEVVLAASNHPPLHQASPLKHSHLNDFTQAPSKPDLGHVHIPPPQAPGNFNNSPQKRAPPTFQPHYYQPASTSQQPLFATFNSNFDFHDQKPYQPTSSAHETADFPSPGQLRKGLLKRSHSDVVPTVDRAIKKIRTEETSLSILPEPDQMPEVEDDGSKPQYSYAQMIGMAILRAPNRRLTLSQIYDWISNTFSFYREDSKAGWHNSIRHNLSLNKAFTKMDRPKGDAGKGSYWVIEPGMETTFLKDKIRKGNAISQITMHASLMRPDMMSASQPMPEIFHPSPFLPQATLSGPRPQTAPALPELSSDATLPASDPALQENEDNVDTALLPQPPSSPPVAMNSSPPIANSTHRRAESSPSAQTRRPASTMRHKRNATAMDDSGYFSSLESSVLRQNKNAVVLTSELDAAHVSKKRKHGRAEDEIQRIRGSSITPSHIRSTNTGFALDVSSSSPVRQSPSLRRDPVTPSVIFKKPIRPPPSVSPTTQLHLHRKAMQEFTNSPIRSFGLFPPSMTDSPTITSSPFKIPSVLDPPPTAEEFEIFADNGPLNVPVTPGSLDSLLDSMQRPSLIRASRSATVLSEVVGGAHANRMNINAQNKTPSRWPNSFLSKASPAMMLNGSPLKGAISIDSFDVIDQENDYFDFDSFNRTDDSDEGLDLGKGFEKIGRAAMPAHAAVKRPGLGNRSLTSMF